VLFAAALIAFPFLFPTGTFVPRWTREPVLILVTLITVASFTLGGSLSRTGPSAAEVDPLRSADSDSGEHGVCVAARQRVPGHPALPLCGTSRIHQSSADL